MSFVVNLLLGLLFGAGLVIGGMADPAKVLNFLDLFGTWDPSLAFVMGGAVITAFFGYRLVLKRDKPIAGQAFNLPTGTKIDRKLIAGASIFGLGWGMAGLCPGPALTSIGLGEPGTLIFVPFMLFGMWMARMLANRPIPVIA